MMVQRPTPLQTLVVTEVGLDVPILKTTGTGGRSGGMSVPKGKAGLTTVM